MKKYLFKSFNFSNHRIERKELVGGSRPRILVRNTQNHHVYILKSYSKNPRELWVELFASLLGNKIEGISVQKASITVIPKDILEELKSQIPKSANELKPIAVLIQHAFPQGYETAYGYKILGLNPTDTPSLDIIFEKITQKYSGFGRDEKNLQSYADMLVFDALKKYNISVSMSRKSSPWENGSQESFYGKLKFELGNLNRFSCVEEVIEAIHLHIYYYNNNRIHTTLKTTPAIFAKMHS